ncbi:MYG1 protein-like [Oppia nitens]|uniref:MYG1 protein-like n=1 Tax=Oppia nitens TaxID=1686743 RepID=UPI0023DB6D04|nr:MYG1 protein-like [Oppia nitens]
MINILFKQLIAKTSYKLQHKALLTALQLFNTKLSMDLSTNSTAKRFCQELDVKGNGIKIGTHDGVFHCDEILACFLLKQLPQYSTAQIIRTRDDKLLDECDVVVDVGGVYDPNCHRYDHHQRDFTHTMSSILQNKSFNIKLSSAGLVFTHFGHQIIARLLNWDKDDNKTDVIFDKVYENFIQEIDAIDNGVSICDGCQQNYRITTNLSSRVGNLIPSWNETSDDDILYQRFLKGIELVGNEFKDKVDYYGSVWWPARQLIQQAIDSRMTVHPCGEIIELTQVFPWKEHLFLLESSNQIKPEVKFVIFQDTRGKWRVQAVPISSHSFELRIPLLSDWRGLRDSELSKMAAIDGCVFVHSSGFIGGNDTREGAIQMAFKTLDNRRQSSAPNS